MKKALLLVSALVLISMACGCGSGSGFNQAGYTYLTLVVAGNGKSATVVAESRLSADVRRLWQRFHDYGTAQAAIPANVATVTITITASDIEPITRTFNVAGQSSVAESFIVVPGRNRSIVVEAKDVTATPQFRGTATVNLDGAPITVPITMVNVAPPIFGGVVAAVPKSETEIDLSWNAASDNETLPASMVYLIYVSTTKGGENFAAPSFTTAPGAKAFPVTSVSSATPDITLTPNTTYYFVVRARDKQGFIDSNVVELAATTFPPPNLGLLGTGRSHPNEATGQWPAVPSLLFENGLQRPLPIS